MSVRKLLVVIDMQRDFVDGALGTPEARAILPVVAQRIAAAREAGETIVFTKDTHGEDYLSTQEGKHLPVPHCIKGTAGWEICEEFPVGDALVFEKGTFGSVRLAEFARSFDEVELVGVCTDICVVSNALLIKAFSPEIVVRVRAAGCAGVTPGAHAAALDTMRSCQVEIIP